MRSVFRSLGLTTTLALYIGNSAMAAPPAGWPTPTNQPTSASAPDSDAARHAKRTACLKEAKSRKLVGAQKTAFIKECTAAP